MSDRGDYGKTMNGEESATQKTINLIKTLELIKKILGNSVYRTKVVDYIIFLGIESAANAETIRKLIEINGFRGILANGDDDIVFIWEVS